jgi:HD superfamily phosphohydrolase
MTAAHTVIRDPVHGDIHLTREELSILDTREMQRLRGIRQLGTAYLVYPGAQHTRFEHSLGTLHMTQRLIDAVNQNRAQAPGALIGIADDEARILRAAALVHDITHIPNGHAIEDQSGLLPRHDSPDRFGRALAAETEVGQALERMAIRREVLAVLAGEAAPALPKVPPYWREILSDTICGDILDYLKRDAYFTGLNLVYDDRVVQYFKVDRESGHLFVDVAKRGLIREDILSELVRVLDARYFFSERVYYHHAKVAAGAMLSLAVENALREGGLAPEALYHQTDDSLVGLLERHGPAEPDAAARHRELLARYRSRRLLKRACVFPLYANRAVQDDLLARFFAPGRAAERAAFEAAVRGRLADRGLVPPIVQLYCPARRMQLKEAATHVRFPGTDEIRPLATFAERLPHLAELERAYRDLWKLYVLAGTEDSATLAAVAGAVAGLLPEATNVYQPRAR